MDREYDVVLALNIFHHFLKDKRSHDKFVRMLQRLQTKIMIFQSHLTSEPQNAWGLSQL